MNNGIFGTTLFGEKKYVAGINVSINDDKSEITYHTINDMRFIESHGNMYGDCVSNTEAKLLGDCIFNYAEHISAISGIKKIQCDVHGNLKNYNHDIKRHGYVLTDKRANDNPFWLETYKKI